MEKIFSFLDIDLYEIFLILNIRHDSNKFESKSKMGIFNFRGQRGSERKK